MKNLSKSMIAITMAALVLSGCGNTQTTTSEEISTEVVTVEAATEAETETQTNEETGDYTFTDDLGREVTVTSHNRVVTMIGSFTDVWILAGGDEVVATAKDSWTSFDFGLSDSVVNFGSHTEPDVEQIIAVEPDFIIASANTDADLELQETFENAGITVAYFSVSNFDDYLNMLKICTDITGREDLYEQNGLAVSEQIEAARERAAKRIEDGTEAPTVLFLRASTSSIKAKGSEGCVGGEILADLGCINIADSDDSLLDDLSMEAIIAANPDYIFITTQGSDAEAIEANIQETLLSNPAWTSLDAVNEGRYYMLEKELYNLKPNARWGEAYKKLETILYGEEE
jgi:iron complex transport system substrate-binding protein